MPTLIQVGVHNSKATFIVSTNSGKGKEMTTKTFSRSKKLTSADSEEKRYVKRQEEMENVFFENTCHK